MFPRDIESLHNQTSAFLACFEIRNIPFQRIYNFIHTTCSVVFIIYLFIYLLFPSPPAARLSLRYLKFTFTDLEYENIDLR